MLGWRHLAASFVLVSASLAAAADNRPFNAALKAACDAAAQQQLQTLALMVRVDPGSDAETDVKQTTAGLRDEIEEVLKNAGFKLQVLTATPSALAPFTPEDLASLKEAKDADGLVCVDYKKTPRARTARISVVTQDKRLFARITAIADTTVVAGNGRSRTGSRRSRTKGNSVQAGSQWVQRGGGSLASMGTNSALLGAALGANSTASTTAAATGTAAASTTSTTVAALNKAILAFAVEKIGQQVGDGECSALAVEALKATNAKPNDGYVWGKPIGIADMQPGDILQFESAVFKTSTTTITMGFPHHTAISYTMTAGKGLILQQNFNGDRTVSALEMDLSTLTSGSVQVYRAQSKDGGDVATPGIGNGTGTGSDSETTDEDSTGGKECRSKAGRGAMNVTVVVIISTGTGAGASTGRQACAIDDGTTETGGTTTGGTTTVTTP